MNKSSEPIAVIGLGCYYPGAKSPKQLWANILSRRIQFRCIPRCRLPLEDYYNENQKAADKTYARMAAVTDGFVFDWANRRIPQSTYKSTDIVHWLALETALQAIADAGFTESGFPNQRTAVIVGNTLTGEYTRSFNLRLRWPFVRKTFLAAANDCDISREEIDQMESAFENYFKSVFPPTNEDSLAGGLSNTIAGRICNFLNCRGGGYTIDAACASSLLAVATAAAGLSMGDFDLALAGGVDVSLDPFELIGFSKANALTSGGMNVYDRRASGFIPGEGCGFVVMKRYAEAIEDGNYIYAILHGWGISSDGANTSITAPNVAGQVLAIKRAYLNTDYGIESLDFIEGHGTGTVAGDRVELEALASLTSEKNIQQKPNCRHYGITSLKSIIGHTKAASGVGGFIKAVMAVNRRICPPTAGCRYPNQVFEETARNLYPIQVGKVFAPTEKLRAGISAMGFGGINCHVTIESGNEPSPRLELNIDERSVIASAQENEVFVLNAKNCSELIAQAEKLIDIADGISYAELTDLASDLGCKLQPGLEMRAALLAECPDELMERLQRLLFILRNELPENEDVYQNSTDNIWIGNRINRCRVGFVFPGQGSQKLNAARFLVERYRWARKLLKTLDRLSKEFGITPLSEIMYVPTDQARDSTELGSWFTRLSQTFNAQPSICFASVLWYRFLYKLGITPAAVGGHSLGEATAFYAAGAFDESTLLRFAFIRSQAMTLEQQHRGSMLSLQCSRQQLEALLLKISEGYVTLANINAPNQVVASGEVAAIDQLSRLATEEGISVYLLPVSNAFHSRLMLPASKRLSKELRLPSKILNLKTSLFSCLDGKEIDIGHNLRRHFINQLTEQVDFVAMVKSITSCADILIEVGPGKILSNLVNSLKNNGSSICIPIESSPPQIADLNALLAKLFVQGVPIGWETLYSGRMVNSFIPARERKFFTNPCEKPLEIGVNKQINQDTHTIPLTGSMLSEVTGLKPEAIRAYLKKRGAFLGEVIKADLKNSPPLNGKVGLENNELYKLNQDFSAHQADAQENRSIVKSLYDLIAEVTGFPIETLFKEARLLDDLNLDSIKAGDIIARYAEQLGLSGIIDPAELTNASIGEIVDLYADLKANQKALMPRMRKISVSETLELLVELASRITSIPSVDLPVDAPIGSGLQIRIDQLRQLMKEASQSIGLDCNIDLQPLLDRSLLHIAKILVRISKNDMQERTPKVDLLNEWVRELKIELIEANRPQSPLGFGKRFEDQWPNARVLILSDNPNNHVCQAVWQRLTASGANVQIRSYKQTELGELQESMDFFSHFVAILPQAAEEINLTENRVKGAIHRLSLAAVPPPASSGPRRRTALTFVQFGGGYFGTRSSADPITQCCATALAKSVHLERKDLKTRIIDFDPKLEADVIAQKIVVEMEGSEDFSEAGYDDQLCRRTPSVYSLEPAEYALDSTAWSETDVVLVTGGAKGITAECAFALARETKIRMALVGRTSIRDSVTPDPEVEKIHTLLQRYEQNGLKARYYSCDVCDRNSLAETVAQIRREMGKITGVVHGAGLNIPRLIKQVSADQALSEVAPKVIGVLNLLEELSEDPPKLILGLTSIIGITGMAGNSWYAFSNEALDLILRRYEAEHPGIRTLSVAYSIWRDEGMGARMGSVSILKKMGIDAIPTEEGVKRFVRLFTHNPKTHQVIITARLAQFSTFEIQPAPFIKGARYLENLLHFTPGVESAFLTRLSLAEDIYLQDHCYEGSFLFPAVFGLEAMAQVVAHLTGVTDFARLRIENLLLSRPITVDPDKGADIIIWAQKQERHSFENNLCVHAGIFKLGTGSKSDFFSATFVMKIDDSVQKRNLNFDRKTLDIYPKTDLYRKTLLFQGSRFQCIDKVCTLECQNSESGLAIITAAPTDPNYGKLAFAGSDNQKLLLGDPFMRDAILQSAALLIPQDTSLPISIRRWDIYPQPTSMQKDNSIYIQTLFEGKGEDDVHTSVKTFDCNGTLIESLKGYRLRKLQHHQEYPTVSDLVCPDDRDTRELNACLSLLAGKFRVKVPEVCVSYLANLHGLPKDQRRELEIPLIRKVVQQWIKQNNADKTEFTIEWQQTGKPMINLSDELLEVSLSHDNRYCIVVAGSWSLGCDIVPVKHRNRKQWFGLLGQIADTLIDDNLNEKELNRLGSAIWAVKEVLYKVKVKQITSIRIEKKIDNGILFLCETDHGELKVLAFWKIFTRGRERVVALSIIESETKIVADESLTVDYGGYSSLIDLEHYKIVGDGPQGQLVFVHRFPVTFMPVGQLSRHIYFTHYFFWAGMVREASAWPVLKKIADQFASGKWGGVTNFADLKILGEATTHDLIEVRMWTSGNGGPENSVLDLTFDFRKVLPDGGYERLALLEQQTTWVRILNHGIAKVEAYPDYYASFLDEMLPKFEGPNLPHPLPEPLKYLCEHKNEDYLYMAPAGPSVKPVLQSQLIETSLEDANIVGNIYFANYYAWQGRVRDRFFHNIIPEYFLGAGEAGELICLKCRVDHLREAMPFDNILVRMALKALKTCHATFYFEYYKANSNQDKLKLATGEQDVVWVHRDSKKRPLAHPFPKAVQKIFRKSIEQK